MIRRGNVATADAAGQITNVLTGTQFETITRRSRIVIRARKVLSAFVATDRQELELESTTLSDGSVQANLGGAGDGNTGLDDTAIIYSGWIDPGNLSLTFEVGNAQTVAWDATLLAVQ